MHQLWNHFSLLLAFVLTVGTAQASTSFSLENLDHVLSLAKEDATQLADLGVVCEDSGITLSERTLKCGVTGSRADENGTVVTTRCYYYCQDGQVQPGNFCKWPLGLDVTLADGYCDN